MLCGSAEMWIGQLGGEQSTVFPELRQGASQRLDEPLRRGREWFVSRIDHAHMNGNFRLERYYGQVVEITTGDRKFIDQGDA